MAMIDTNGLIHLQNRKTQDINYITWLKNTKENYISFPFNSKIWNRLLMAISVPVYDANKNITATLVALTDGFMLCNETKEIKVENSGYCYVFDEKVGTIAEKNREMVSSFENSQETATWNSSLLGLVEQGIWLNQYKN